MARQKRKSTPISKIFADNISILVAEKKETSGLNQNEIAREMGVSDGSLSGWCSDEKTITIDSLAKVSAYFGVSVDWLLGLNENRSPDVEKLSECKYTGLNEEAVDAIMFDRTHCDYDGNRYSAFLNSLLVNTNFRYLLSALYRFTTANEGENLYSDMFFEFDMQCDADPSKRTQKEFARRMSEILKRQDIHSEVKGMFLLQAKLNSLDDAYTFELTKDVADVSIGDVYRLYVMNAFEDLLDEDLDSPCFKQLPPAAPGGKELQFNVSIKKQKRAKTK